MLRKKQPYLIIRLFCVLLFSGSGSFGHPISQSSVTADVYSNRVEVTVEVKLEDLAWFQDLKTNAVETLEFQAIESSGRKHQQFLIDYFHIIDTYGNEYVGTARQIDFGSKDAYSMSDLQTASIRYRYEYRLPKRFTPVPPKHLAIWQNFGGVDAPVPSMMELQIKHRGAWLGRSVNLPSDIPHISRFDWDASGAPPKSLAEIRERKARTTKESLGLADYGGVYSFVFRNPGSLSHQLLIPYEKLKLLLPGDWPTNEVIDSEVLKRIEMTVARELPKYHHAISGGNKIAPRIYPPRLIAVDQIEIQQEFRTSTVHAKLARIALTVGFNGLARNQLVELHWSAFDKTVSFLRSMIFDRGHQSPRQVFFTAQKPLGTIGPGIKRSNEFEICARRVIDEQLRQSFANAGGESFPAEWRFAGTPITAVETAGSVIDGVAFRFGSLKSSAKLHVLKGKLSVSSSESHWGHVHQWTDEFEAQLRVETFAGKWTFSWELESGTRVRVGDAIHVSEVKRSTVIR